MTRYIIYVRLKVLFEERLSNIIYYWIISIDLDYILIDLNWIFSMTPPEFKISISFESYDEKTAENNRNCNVAEKYIVPTCYL